MGLAYASASSSSLLRLRTSIDLEDEESSGSMGCSWRSGMALLMSLFRPSKRSAARRMSNCPVGWPLMSRRGMTPVRTATSWSFSRSPIGMERLTRSISMMCGEALGAMSFGITG